MNSYEKSEISYLLIMPTNIHLFILDYSILVLYCLFVVEIGFALKHYMKTSADFFMSGRSIPARVHRIGISVREPGMKLREQFPKLRMVGHFNKLVMSKGEETIRAEFERLVPLMKTGGSIPSVDHQTPPGGFLGTIPRLSATPGRICENVIIGSLYLG